LDVSKKRGKYHTVVGNDTPNTHIRDCSLSCVGEDTPNTHIRDRSLSCVDNDTPNSHIPYCRNSSKIHKTNGRKRGKTDIPNTYT